MAYKEDLDIGKITLISLVSVLTTVAIVLFLQVLFYGYRQRQLASPRYTQVPAQMAKYVADQQGKLASYAVVDRQRQVVAIPIDRAMTLVVDELSADPQAHVTGVLDPEDAAESAAANAAPGEGDAETPDEAPQPTGEPSSQDDAAPRSADDETPGSDEKADTGGEPTEAVAPPAGGDSAPASPGAAPDDAPSEPTGDIPAGSAKESADGAGADKRAEENGDEES